MIETIAILGGTFNPPHLGHIRPAIEALDITGIQQLGLMPNRQSPLKDRPNVSDADRLAMLELCCAYDKRLFIEDLELSLPPPSYSVNTLKRLREKHPSKSICFFLGTDSLYTLPSWYEWQSLLDWCHLVVMARPTSHPLGKSLTEWIATHATDNVAKLQQTLNGYIYIADTTMQVISSTELRYALTHRDNQTLQRWLPRGVMDYIHNRNLYQVS